MEKNIKKIEKPLICLFDFEDNDIQKLTKQGYQIYSATLGRKIQLPKHNNKKYSHFKKDNYNIPDNFHEYKVVIFGFCEKKLQSYEEEEIVNDYCVVVENTKSIFNPQPLSAEIIKSKIEKLVETKSLIVLFGENEYSQIYSIYSNVYENNNYKHIKDINCNLYSFIDFARLSAESKNGFDFNFISEDKKFKNLKLLIENNKKNINYKSIFRFLPYTTGDNKIFIPLMKNIDNEIISFILYYKNSTILVLPNMKNKGEILESLIIDILPELNQELFPYSTQFSWLKLSEYNLPSYNKLLNKKKEIEQKYIEEINKINSELIKNKEEFEYLSQMLKETDEILLKAVKNFLEWLGFTNIIIPDETKSTKEEDLQIKTQKGLLLIEIKGIKNTSKDTDCNQISKIIKRTRILQPTINIYGLYIANQERFTPPLERRNPPFTKNQIEDAKNDERGLLTTWDLFNLFVNIENGLITKNEAMNKFHEVGYISFI